MRVISFINMNSSDESQTISGAKPNRFLTLTLKGFCMGTADVIPGVSGGTMAFILGIYLQLIDAIKSFDSRMVQLILKLDFKQALQRPHFPFLVPLFTGILAALIFFTRIIPLPKLLTDYPEQVYGLFFGLIAGSCVILIRNTSDLKIRDFVMIITGIIPGLLIFNMGTQSMPDTSPYIFISGFLAISAMMLPGISGSFILLILGKYSYIFNAIGYFRVSVLLPLIAGMLIGLITFSRLLSWLLHHYYRNTTMIITGILIASLWVIWPFQERIYIEINMQQKLVSASPVLPSDFGSVFLISSGLMVTGMLIVLVLDNLASKRV